MCEPEARRILRRTSPRSAFRADSSSTASGPLWGYLGAAVVRSVALRTTSNKAYVRFLLTARDSLSRLGLLSVADSLLRARPDRRQPLNHKQPRHGHHNLPG